ncbi:hypothetical protein ACHQM5_006971 [Ranunculus cassubicifolius]
MKAVEFTEGQEVEHAAEELKDLWYPAKVIGFLDSKSDKKKKLLIEYQWLIDDVTRLPLSCYVDVGNVRPKPPSQNHNSSYHLNQNVDAFHSNGWMKGKIIKIGEEKSSYTLYFPDSQILDFGLKDLRLHQDWTGGRWVTPQNQGINLISQNVSNVRSPTSRTTLVIDMATPQIPTMVMCNMPEDALSVSRYTGGMMNNQSTFEKVSASSAVNSGQEIMNQSDSTSSIEFSQIPACSKACNAGGTHSKSDGGSATCNKMASENNVDEYSEGIGLATPHVRCQKETDVSLPAQQKKELAIDTDIPRVAIEEGGTETKNVKKRKRFRESGKEHSSGSSRSELDFVDFENISASNHTATVNKECMRTADTTMKDTGEAPSTDNPSQPFIKASPLWSFVEDNEVFRMRLQTPHFRPLEKENVECREGLAVGYMWTFVSLWEGARKAQLDDPRIKFEIKLQALPNMEELGFNVDPIRSRLEALVKLKDSNGELEERIKMARQEFMDEKQQHDEMEESIAQMNLQLQALLEEKAIIDGNQQRRDEIKKSMREVRDDFIRVAAAPWVSTMKSSFIHIGILIKYLI